VERDWKSALGWLLSLNMQSFNDCCDREQTVKNITRRFSEPQELTQLAWSLVDNGIQKVHGLCPLTQWETIMESVAAVVHREPWNKGKIVGQKAPFKPKDIWALRVRLQMENRVRELALFNLGIDSKLRGCDLVALKVRDVCHGDQVASRATVMQHKTHHPVQFELTATTREALQQWIKTAKLKSEDYIFPSRLCWCRCNLDQLNRKVPIQY